MRNCKLGHRRRGMLILIVLSLLAMFAVLGVAFVILTGQVKRTSLVHERSEQYYEPAERVLEQVFKIVVRGSDNWACAAGRHSLLEDMYGDDTLPGTAAAITPVCGGQLLNLTVNIPEPAKRVGCVLTALSGPAAGKSTRIVGYDPTTSQIQVLAFEGISDVTVPMDFVINGPAFSGTGAGYNPNTGRLDWEIAPGRPVALLPRLFAGPLDYNAWVAGPDHVLGTPDDRTLPPMMANEDYDAVDHQNMFLAMQLPDGRVPIPSFHRPELVNYWMNELGADWTTNPDFQRRVILRPLPADHPNFTGSNPNFNPTWDGVSPGGAWDVDNDGDGIADSIWVDFGLPVRSLPDGQLYKPLAAVLCVDLDGRLNVNAHGTYAQAELKYRGYYSPVSPNHPYFRPRTMAGEDFMFSQNARPMLPRGFGYGPAEINLLPLFGDPSDVKALGAYANLLQMRYKPSLVPGSPSPADDPLHFNKWFDYGGNYWGSASDGWFPIDGSRAYGTPPNRLGDGAIGLDPGGRPLYLRMGRADPFNLNDERLNDPYKLNLSKPTAVNSPFTPVELERLLRFYDLDAARFPSRLIGLAGRRHEITTESWHVPAPTFIIPRHLLMEGDRPNAGAQRPGILDDLAAGVPPPVATWLRGLLPGRSVQDLLKAKLYVQHRRAQAPGPPDYAAAMTAAENLLAAGADRVLLPWELGARLKMDLNRPFGNGRDDNANGVVDDPFEPEVFYQVNSAGALVTTPFALDRLGGVPTGLLARQLYARHLYVLMMLVADVDKIPVPEGTTNPDRVRARMVAQWAINAVDFRDRDAIMSPFEYDAYPFTDENGDGNPWDVDSDIWTNDSALDKRVARGLVWGCERPELLITETLALHDRRVQNLKVPGGLWQPIRQGQEPPEDWDKDFDQQKMPQGSLLVELYNPGSPLEAPPGISTDLAGVQLSARAPDGSPVWRMLVVRPKEGSLAPCDDPDPDDGSPTSDVRRSIYFTDVSKFEPGHDGAIRFHSPKGARPIPPGHYAVVGPPVTYVGHRTTWDPGDENHINEPTDRDQTRQIRLTDSGLEISPVAANGGSEPASGTIRPVVCIPIDTTAQGYSRRLNISDPPVTNPPEGYRPYPDPKIPAYMPAYDRPFDYSPMGRDPEMAEAVRKVGTTPRVAILHLQRLADPSLPYNVTDPNRPYNPYRTIDSSSIDLVAFNGWDRRDEFASEGWQGDGALLVTVMFATHQRGQKAKDDPTNYGPNNLWLQLLALKELVATPPGDGSHYFNFVLQHSLGFLNGSYTQQRWPDGPNKGDPSDMAFPWLNWNNRPYISELELLLVPAAKSWALLQGFRLAAPGDPYRNPALPFAHLLNFFQSGPDAPNLARLLDLVGVPSPFVGTEIQASPAVFAGSPGHTFLPPFNRIANYREPGRMNINTVFSRDVWTGLMNYYPGLTAVGFFEKVFGASRKGHAGDDLDPTYPTRFANPVRSYAGQMLTAVPTQYQAEAEVNATLLRRDPRQPDRPLFGLQSVEDCTNTDRNPFFRYQGLQRLGNLVTTRSNVYAIWITVGYFEVQPWPGGIDAAHPDGYMLGQEVGSDTGEIRRHRAFYIFDRSIPVGFVHGQDLNVEKGVLVKRYIE
ncbi:MAG: hypothetical protein ACUVUC_11885 [Thermoguttaceae bacterium]